MLGFYTRSIDAGGSPGHHGRVCQRQGRCRVNDARRQGVAGSGWSRSRCGRRAAASSWWWFTRSEKAVGGADLGRLPSGVSRGRLNLVVITLDTTRADRIGAYGAQEVETPVLDRLANEGVLFEQTASVAPLTLPAHASIFTGKFPPEHGVRDNGGFFLGPNR